MKPDDYQKALDVQYACNLSGVVQSFSRVFDDLWETARAEGYGTEWVNRHPICRLYASKIESLTSGRSYLDAYEMAIEGSKKEAI